MPRVTGRLLIVASMGFNLVAVLAGSALAAAGDLDTAFSGDGKQTTNFTSRADTAYAVAIQSDGKIVAAGSDSLAGPFPHSTNERFALARYDTDGTLDTTFGGDGKVTTDLTAGQDEAFALAIQTDGKIVAVETADDRQFALVRYNGDGSLDTTFSDDGMATTDFSAGIDAAYGLAIQPADEKIVAAGTGGGNRFALARYNTDGTLDTSFSIDGKLTTNITSTTGDADRAESVAIQSDGRIVAGGRAGGSGGRFALARYNSDGTLDTAFSSDGKVTTDFTSLYDAAFDITIQPADGKIVAAGTSQGGSSDLRFALARYDTDGTLDPTFSGDGKLTTRFTSGNDWATGVSLQLDGKIVAAGRAGGSGGRFAVARYNTNGTLDGTFSGDGKVATNFSTYNDEARDVAVQTSDGRIVLAGVASISGGTFALSRYLAA